MSQKFIYFYFILLIIFILIGNISLTQKPEFENLIIDNSVKEFINSDFHYNKNSIYSWPLFGYYSISSYFGKRLSPTSRSI